MGVTIGRRRRVLVDKPLQLGFLLVCFGYIFAFMLMMGGALFLPLIIELSNKQTALAETAANQFLLLHQSFWPAVLVSIVLLSLHAVLISHRFAGPLYRHKRIYQEISSGKIPGPFIARKGDFLVKETTGLNAMIESLRFRMGEIQAAEYQLDEALAKLRESAAAGGDDQLKAKLAAVSEYQEKLREKIEYFQTEA